MSCTLQGLVVTPFCRIFWATMLLWIGVLPAVPYAPGTEGYPQRRERKDSFLGIHFDFHAGPDDTEIGNDVTPDMVHAILDKIKPDYIQIDCKGHPGYSSYPTKVGHQAGGFIGDPLRIWREVTAKRGVALFMHYSGVWDNKALDAHPDWAVINADGRPDKQKTSVFGPYVDQLLIPQIKELWNEYGIDGVWIDGECWATVPDYNPAVIEIFKQKTGITEIPDAPGKPHWYEWMAFHREGFRSYARHYTDTLHRDCPGVQITSNWAFSSMMPEPVTIEFDYLSGDYALQDSARDARWQARCLRGQGKPWDLMAWGFSSKWEHLSWRSIKTAKQLCREAAVVLANGGGFQCFYNQRRDGSVRLWQIEAMAETAQFCRARQAFCHRAQSVPQIALFYSTEAVYRSMENLFQPGNHHLPIRGILNALLDGQQHVEVVMEHQLKGNCRTYPMIVFPEWEYVDPEMYKELMDYVEDGGNLLIVGARSIELFKEPLGITAIERYPDVIRWLHYEGKGAGLKAAMAKVTLTADARPVGQLIEEDDPLLGQGWTAASVRPLGKGKIAAIYTNIGQLYNDATTTVMRDFMSALVQQLLPEPMVEVSGSHLVDVVVNRIMLDGRKRLAVNLTNMAGEHRNKDVYTFDQIPPIGPLTIRMRLDKKPKQILRQPEGEVMRFKWHKGIAEMTLPRLEIHDILVVY